MNYCCQRAPMEFPGVLVSLSARHGWPATLAWPVVRSNIYLSCSERDVTTHSNADIARILRAIAVFLDMEDVAFKPRAYEKAAYAVEALDEPLSEVYRRGGFKAICEVPGIGKSIGEKLAVLLQTGSLPYYEELRKKTPVDLDSLTAIDGLGPKM